MDFQKKWEHFIQPRFPLQKTLQNDTFKNPLQKLTRSAHARAQHGILSNP